MDCKSCEARQPCLIIATILQDDSGMQEDVPASSTFVVEETGFSEDVRKLLKNVEDFCCKSV